VVQIQARHRCRDRARHLQIKSPPLQSLSLSLRV
jgi:hypothetical protein